MRIQPSFPAGLGVVWGRPGHTLDIPWTHRPPSKSDFQSGKLIEIAFLARLRAEAASVFGCWMSDVGCWMFNPLGFSPIPRYPLPRQMAVESKPLFHPEVLRQQVRSFLLPEQNAALQPKLEHWAELIRSGRADQFKESELLPDFLTDFFCGLLGYTGPAEGADTYTVSRERHVEVEVEFADAVLGRFQKGKEQFVMQPTP